MGPGAVGKMWMMYHMGCADMIGMAGMALESTAMGKPTVISLVSIPKEPSCRNVITLMVSCTDIILTSMKMEASVGNLIISMVCASRACCSPACSLENILYSMDL